MTNVCAEFSKVDRIRSVDIRSLFKSFGFRGGSGGGPFEVVDKKLGLVLPLPISPFSLYGRGGGRFWPPLYPGAYVILLCGVAFGVPDVEARPPSRSPSLSTIE